MSMLNSGLSDNIKLEAACNQSIWLLKCIENGSVTNNFENWPTKDHFNLNFWAEDFDVISI